MGKNRAFTVVELLVVAGIFLVTMLVLAPFVRMARERANKINCDDNLRHISLGLHMYAADHDGEFPPNLAVLYPNYVENQNTFDCPASRSIGSPAKADYNYAPGLTEKTAFKEVIVEDLDGNHRGGKNVLKASGSIEWVGRR